MAPIVKRLSREAVPELVAGLEDIVPLDIGNRFAPVAHVETPLVLHAAQQGLDARHGARTDLIDRPDQLKTIS